MELLDECFVHNIMALSEEVIVKSAILLISTLERPIQTNHLLCLRLKFSLKSGVLLLHHQPLLLQSAYLLGIVGYTDFKLLKSSIKALILRV